MKIGEFRKAIQTAERKDLEKTAACLYKMLNKAQKEEMDEDLLEIIHGNSERVAKGKKKEEVIDFNELAQEVNQFLSYARDGLYCYANWTVSKQKRSNWRHEFNRYFNQLVSIEAGSPDYEQAGELLMKLFRILGMGCSFRTFVSTNPFEAVKIQQVQFVKLLADRFCTPETPPEKLDDFLYLVNGTGMDYMTLRAEFYPVINDRLVDFQFRNRVIERLENLRKQTCKLEKLGLNINYEDFMSNDAYESIPRLILYLMAKSDRYTVDDILKVVRNEIQSIVDEYEGRSPYSKSVRSHMDPEQVKRQVDRFGEIQLFVALSVLNQAGRDDLWIAAFEDATKKFKITPRDSLLELYQQKKAVRKRAT